MKVKTEKSLLENTLIWNRESDGVALFSAQEDGSMIVRLKEYVIMPLELYGSSDANRGVAAMIAKNADNKK